MLNICIIYTTSITTFLLQISLSTIMRRNIVSKLLLLLVVTMCFRGTVQSCKYNPNQKRLIYQHPTLLNKTTNGQKLLIGSFDDPQQNYVYIARLKGTSYEMGKAFGQLFKQELKSNLPTFYSYYLDQLTDLMVKNHVPGFIAKGLTKGVKHLALGLLDLNVMITKKYTHKRYLQEINGIADGAKINKKDIERVNIVPEVIKAACTVAGVWGPATINKQTLHVRSLDWDAANPISKYPVIIVYHPSTKAENMHANFAWVGFVGALTGMSPYLSIGQKVWYPPQNSVQMTRYGNPWTYVLRDVLYDANNISTALSVLTNTHRTCAIHLGLGSKEDHSFRMFEYAQKILNNYDDKNYTHYNQSYHPKRAGIAFFDKGVQPNNNPCVGDLLTNKTSYGTWEMESLWRVVGNSHETGDTQHVVFNLESQEVLISYSRNYQEGNQSKVETAFRRSPIYVNMNNMWEQF